MAMSIKCKCGHIRGEHEWSELMFHSNGTIDNRSKPEPCVDDNCKCENFDEVDED